MDRRDFLGASATMGAAALLDAFPPSIRRALALPASSATGTIEDVQHIVILMQENRSFDHYFGALGGVRGFDDRTTAPLRGGRSIWQQPDGQGGMVMPFPMPSSITNSQHVHSLPHGWIDGHAAWANGRYDNWVPAKGALTMGHYTRNDLPYHYALADAFTVCDAYHCSVPGATNPNRSFLMTGTLDPYGTGGGPMKDQPDEGPDFQPLHGPTFSYDTYPERLQAAGVSWRVYQGIDVDGAFPADAQDSIRHRDDPYPDDQDASVSCFNVLRFFKQFANAPRDSPLYCNAMTRRPPTMFAADAKAGTLPQVSWVLPPHNCSEHPEWSPANGATFISFVLDALTANPETWSKTVLLVMYDENDGFFDHVLPPAPPEPGGPGASNVDVAAEINAKDGLLFGLGARVPLLAISPWSKGGAVCSQVFDHTSVIRFLEARFGVREPNISAWRRSVCGDLTSVFNFSAPDAQVPSLPDAKAFLAGIAGRPGLPAPAPPSPELQSLQRQEVAQRVARALPYELHAHTRIDVHNHALELQFVNSGRVGAVFHVFDRVHGTAPARYTLDAQTQLTAEWPVDTGGACDIEVLGPNGFLRQFVAKAQDVGLPADGSLQVRASYTAAAQLRLTLLNDGPTACSMTIHDNAYGATARVCRLPAGGSKDMHWELASSNGWYDLSVAAATPANGSWRFAGHVETGNSSMTDPVLGLGATEVHGFAN